ncbi:MAG: hypothetical protein ACR2QO_08190, partial [Acidimicrobiales bacterium]
MTTTPRSTQGRNELRYLYPHLNGAASLARINSPEQEPQRLIFQLGSNNWQSEQEFAPGSGILHEQHHNT